MADIKTVRFKEFDGIKSLGEPTEIGKSALITGVNIDITNRKNLHRRPGKTRILRGNFHSLYSNGNICLAVLNNNLVNISSSFTTTILRLSVGQLRMSYVSVGNTIYYTNDIVIGYIENGISNEFTEPTEEFRVRTFPGKLIEYYLGRLYIAKLNRLWYTDALRLNSIDMRMNFLQFPNDIVMVRAVDDGLYVSDTKSTYFIGGTNPKQFVLREIYDYPAISGTDISIVGQNINVEYQGSVVLWVGQRGICIGMNGGQTRNITDKQYVLPLVIEGASTIRLDEIKQYVTSFYAPGIETIIRNEVI